jgi:hypothetical protein
MRVKYEIFESAPRLLPRYHPPSDEPTFQNAADFASKLPADRLISVSQSMERGFLYITVWYWADDEPTGCWYWADGEPNE